ncbi:MAG: oligosaccharide flippase family protein [Chloroflexota bacterium]|nr:oligosaccharide flippase family protein [Chloroflexota bacterium]
MGQHLGIPLYKNAYYLMANTVTTSLLGFVFWMVVAKFYNPADVGLASALIAATGLLASLSNLGLGFGLIKFLPNTGEKATRMINSCFTISGLVSVFAALIFLGGLDFWSPALLLIREHPIFLFAFLTFTVVFTLSPLLDQTFIAERSAKFAFIKNVAAGVIKIPIPVMLAAFFGAFGIFASAGLGVGIAAAVAALWLLPRMERGYRPFPTLQKEVVNDMIHYSLGNYVAQLLWVAPSLVFPLMVVNVLSAEANAHFYIAWMIAGLVMMIPNAISISLFAEGSYNEKELLQNTKKSLVLAILVVLPAVLLVFALGSKVLLLFGETYSRNATTLLRVLVISSFPLSINYLYLSFCRVRRNVKGLIRISAVASCLALGLTYPLIVRVGILGMGIGWTITQSLVALIIIFILFGKRRHATSVA